MQTFDVVIVGAGPVGLYAAYYAGMRGLSVAIIENFDEAGGQPLNIYPEKHIFDVAGLPQANGAELTENLLVQLKKVDYTLLTGQMVSRIEKIGDHFELTTSKEKLAAKAVLLATGHGLLNPRKIGVEGEEAAYQSGKLAYFVKDLESYRGQKVAVLGGGDSALDWALMLENVASEVHVIHRRQAFRAAAATVAQLETSSVQVHTPYTVSALTETGLRLTEVKGDDERELTTDRILVNYGFLIEDDAIVPGLELTRNHRVVVSRTMVTNIDGLYAAGDCCDYEGRVPLIAVGFGEAIIAVNAMTQTLDFGHKLRNGHSSSIFDKAE